MPLPINFPNTPTNPGSSKKPPPLAITVVTVAKSMWKPKIRKSSVSPHPSPGKINGETGPIRSMVMTGSVCEGDSVFNLLIAPPTKEPLVRTECRAPTHSMDRCLGNGGQPVGCHQSPTRTSSHCWAYHRTMYERRSICLPKIHAHGDWHQPT